MLISSPTNEEELLIRAQALAGQSLEQLAQRLAWPVPSDLRHAKGWPGELLERALGAFRDAARESGVI